MLKYAPQGYQSMTLPTQITRVVLENYKSIAECDVRLQPLTIVVGPNGAGKSNFLDALQFVSDVLLDGFDRSISDRGGIEELLHHAPGKTEDRYPRTLGVHLSLQTHDDIGARFSVVLRSIAPGDYFVAHEECTVEQRGDKFPGPYYRLESGNLETNMALLKPVTSTQAPDRLILQRAAAYPEFASVYRALSAIRSYHIDPVALRVPRALGQTSALSQDGTNIASVLRGLAQSGNGRLDRIQRYLAALLPGFEGVEIRHVAGLGILYFRMTSADGRAKTDYPITSMSDGTLRALVVLVALFQTPASTLNLLEEPETAVHPGAIRVLLDAMFEASERNQILITTHSPDLLDQKDIPEDSVLAVEAEEGVTRIGPIDDVGRSAMRDRLFTAGELLRTGGLHPVFAGATPPTDGTL
jgi:predicted ATPase